MDNANERKRARDKPQKKWTDAECHLILEYILEKGNFEKPTAQLFYCSLLKHTQIDATWDILKWKMRHLKQSFHKAVDWQSSTDAVSLEQEEGIRTVQDKILKMCPHYEKLKKIFGFDSQPCIEIITNDFYVPVEASLSSPTAAQIELFTETSSPIASPSTSSPSAFETASQISLPAASPPAVSSPASATLASSKKRSFQFAGRIRKNPPNSAISQLAILQSERTEFYEKKLQLENKKFEINNQLEEKKLKLEEQKMEIEIRKIELEEKKLEQEYELRKLDMEKQERIAKYEIQMKWKHSNNNF